jgi:hypothetical protein
VQPSTIPEALIAAYRATIYTSRIKDADEVMRIGEKATWLADLFDTHSASTALFITAENPFSEPHTDTENAEAQEQLRQCLLTATDIVFDGWGTGADTGWPPENSFLALGLNLETARTLGKQFHQNAVVWVGADAIPQLILLA